MVKTITAKELTQKVSESYRQKLAELREVRAELSAVNQLLLHAHKTNGEYISMMEYNRLTEREKRLKTELELKTQFCEGMAYARERVMDHLGYDIIIED